MAKGASSNACLYRYLGSVTGQAPVYGRNVIYTTLTFTTVNTCHFKQFWRKRRCLPLCHGVHVSLQIQAMFNHAHRYLQQHCTYIDPQECKIHDVKWFKALTVPRLKREMKIQNCTLKAVASLQLSMEASPGSQCRFLQWSHSK